MAPTTKAPTADKKPITVFRPFDEEGNFDLFSNESYAHRLTLAEAMVDMAYRKRNIKFAQNLDKLDRAIKSLSIEVIDAVGDWDAETGCFDDHYRMATWCDVIDFAEKREIDPARAMRGLLKFSSYREGFAEWVNEQVAA
jgi:hypothetical protein